MSIFNTSMTLENHLRARKHARNQECRGEAPENEREFTDVHVPGKTLEEHARERERAYKSSAGQRRSG